MSIVSSIDVKEFRLIGLKLVYKTDLQTKWLLEVHIAGKKEKIPIYLSRPANETENQLMYFIKSCNHLSDLIFKNCSIPH